MMLRRRHSSLLLAFVFWLLPLASITALWSGAVVMASADSMPLQDGPSCVQKGKELYQNADYDNAALEFWKAVLLHEQTPPDKKYNVQEVFQLFMQCYIVQGRMADGFAFVAAESFQRGQREMGESYLQQALAVDPQNTAARAVQREFQAGAAATGEDEGTVVVTRDDEKLNQDLAGKTPEQLYEVASGHFAEKNFEECADIFELSCLRSNQAVGPSCANAVYCRSMISDYGFNGSQFDADMQRISALTAKESSLYRIVNHNDEPFAWRRATSVHPHMVGVVFREVRLNLILPCIYTRTDVVWLTEFRCRSFFRRCSATRSIRNSNGTFPSQ